MGHQSSSDLVSLKASPHPFHPLLSLSFARSLLHVFYTFCNVEVNFTLMKSCVAQFSF